MESRFYRDDFEKYLRDQTDQFKMYPDRKVWHSVYNDLYPGKKWPSVTTTLLVLFLLFFVNNFNSFTSSHPELNISNNQKGGTTAKNTLKARNSHVSSVPGNSAVSTISSEEEKVNTVAANTAVIPEGNNIFTRTPSKRKLILSLNSPKNYLFAKMGNEDKLHDNNEDLDDKEEVQTTDNDIPLTSLQKPNRDRISWSYFMSPTINFRTLSNNGPAYTDIYNDLSKDNGQSVAIGFEVGSNLNYQLSENFKFTTGVQLNYSSYDIAASSVHPQIANIVLNEDGSPKVVSATANYGPAVEGDSKITLHNYSLQASIPIGMQYKILGNDKLSISAGASFQPFYVISSNSYMLASDKNLYVNYPSLMRDFNLNTEVGTYVTFKVNKFNWQIGPRFRYQLLSTYTNSSPYSEHLLNYGLKFGISKNK